VVQRKEELYQCLSCDFKRDFSKPPKAKSNNGIVWATIVAAIATLLVLEVRNTYSPSNSPSFQPQSLSKPTPIQTARN
ncbi:MAG TPA: hypothetical protein V6C95_19230, partial [Coleofasciculaceae cyanobacterium]